MATTPIPLSTLTVGTHPIGPVPVPVGVKGLLLVIDRTAGASSLNTRAASTTLVLSLDETQDSGATWRRICDATAIGGSYIDNETSLTITASSIQTEVAGNINSSARQVRGQLVVSGQSISLSGSLTTS